MVEEIIIIITRLKEENQLLKNKIIELEKIIDMNNVLTYSCAKACSNSKADFIMGKIRESKNYYITRKEIKNLIIEHFNVKSIFTMNRYIRILINMKAIKKSGTLFRIIR